MKQKIINLDPDFNFEEFYKRKSLVSRRSDVLINFDIREVCPEVSFFVDSISETIKYPRNLFCVYYREWGNSNWFPVEGPIEKKFYYWTLYSGAVVFKEEIIIANKLEVISKEEAFELLNTRFSF